MRRFNCGRAGLQVLWICLLGLLCVSSVLMGCRSATDVDTPPDIRYGEDVCDQCRMIISDKRFAAAYVTSQGETRRFDDIGDLVLYHRTHAEEVAVFWVHDYDSRAWLRAEQALFVTGPAIHTPMGHGIVAFDDQQRAAAMAAAHQSDVLTFAELLRHPMAAGADSAHPPGRTEHTRHDKQTTQRRTTP